MKITIDTKIDSKEEIKKVIGMLQSIVGNEVFTNEPVQDSKFEQAEQSLSPSQESSLLSSAPESAEPMPSVLGDFFANMSTASANSPAPKITEVSAILEEVPKSQQPKVETYY